jgi:phosphoglycolate phosphatase
MLVIFDYDGVLVDSRDQLLVALTAAQARLKCGRVPTRADLETIPSFTFADVGRLCGVPEPRLSAYSDAVLERLRRDREQPPLFPGISRTIAALAAHHTLAIVTANLRQTVESVLRRERLLPWITRILDLRDPGAKSEKIGLLRRTFGWGEGETYMIGDARSDVRQGKLAGVRTVAAAWGMQRRELLLAEEPDFVADRHEELLPILGMTEDA